MFLFENEESFMYDNNSDSEESIIIVSDSTGSDYDSSSDSDYYFDTILENMFFDEEEFLDAQKKDGNYYLGFPCFVRNPDAWILETPIQAKTFLKNNMNDIIRYLTEYSVIRMRRPKVHIMKLIKKSGVHNVVLKTHWLRLVQRTWKRIYKERTNIIRKRCNPRAILKRQLYGSWGKHNNNFPTLKNMLELC